MEIMSREAKDGWIYKPQEDFGDMLEMMNPIKALNFMTIADLLDFQAMLAGANQLYGTNVEYTPKEYETNMCLDLRGLYIYALIHCKGTIE